MLPVLLVAEVVAEAHAPILNARFPVDGATSDCIVAGRRTAVVAAAARDVVGDVIV